MALTILYAVIPSYNFYSAPDLGVIAAAIDQQIEQAFSGQPVVIRGIQAQKHALSRPDLITLIRTTGTDHYQLLANSDVGGQTIDLFGRSCNATAPITLPILEGFHRWKPKSLERPQFPVDIWMIYDATQLQNVEYVHDHYNVPAHDGYVFIDSAAKPDALLGLLVIN